MDDLYFEVGQTIHIIQSWENDFKNFTIKNHIDKSDDKRSLTNMNSFLLREKIITEKEFLLIKEIIEMRNFIIHKLFLSSLVLQKEEIKNYLYAAKNKIYQSLSFIK